MGFNGILMGFNGILMGFNGNIMDFVIYVYRKYPLVNVYSLLLKMVIEIVDFPMTNGDFP